MLLSSKDKSCLWHIQPAFTQGLKSYIYSTKMFKLALKHSSSGKLIGFFCAATESSSFPQLQVYIHVFAHTSPTLKCASTFRRKPYDICEWQEQTSKHCSCLFKHNFVLSYGPACAMNTAAVLQKHNNITLLKAASQCTHPGEGNKINLANHHLQKLVILVSFVSSSDTLEAILTPPLPIFLFVCCNE